MQKQRLNTRKMVSLSLFSAIIVVLQVLCTFIRFGPFSITLALAPIIVGGALYGIGAGALLGAVFGAVVLVTGLFGWDGGTVLYLMGQNTVATILICLVKGAAAGATAAFIYRVLSKRNRKIGVTLAGILCPVVNTGLFILGMMAFFFSTLQAWADGEALIYYIIFGLTGGNFLVELATNLVLSAGLTRIIRASA